MKPMAHLQKKSKKLISRIRRLQGQLEAVIRGIESGQDCTEILQTAAACKGAFSGLIFQLLEDHIDSHIASTTDVKKANIEGKKLSEILRSYVR